MTGNDRLAEIVRATREGSLVPRGTPLRPVPVEATLDVRPSRCLVPHCEGDPRAKSAARGLCKAHHMTALRLVRSKATTWEELEASGRCFSGRKRGEKGPAARWLLGDDSALVAPASPPRTDAEAVRAALAGDVDTLRALVLGLLERADRSEFRISSLESEARETERRLRALEAQVAETEGRLAAELADRVLT